MTARENYFTVVDWERAKGVYLQCKLGTGPNFFEGGGGRGGRNFMGHGIFFSLLGCAWFVFLVGNNLCKNFLQSQTQNVDSRKHMLDFYPVAPWLNNLLNVVIVVVVAVDGSPCKLNKPQSCERRSLLVWTLDLTDLISQTWNVKRWEVKDYCKADTTWYIKNNFSSGSGNIWTEEGWSGEPIYCF